MNSSIGNVLKEARAKKSVSLDEAYSKTKIHPNVLRFLEEDKFDKLPSPLFVKSFLKSYAQFLEVDGEGLVRQYESQGKKDPKQVLYLKPAEFEPPSFLAPAIFKWGLLFVVLLLGALVLTYLFKTAVNGMAQWRGHAVTVKSLKPVVKKPAKQSLSSAWLYSPELGNFPKLNKNASLELEIKAVNDVWLRITCDGKVLFESILKRGITNVWTAKDRIELWTGNPASMQLTLNHEPLGSPGKHAQQRMIVSHEGIQAA